MRICTAPKVYLVARSQLAEGALDFLEDLDLKWPTEALGGDDPCTDAEQLTELAGRCCYMSFGAKAGSKTNREYLDNLIGMQKGRTPEAIAAELEGMWHGLSDHGGDMGQALTLITELKTSIEAQRQPAHGSVLEHATFSFLVVGAGRGFSHEQVRHRAGWAYSQLSTRYCDFERAEAQEGTWDPGFTIPPLGQLSKGTASAFAAGHRDALARYKTLLIDIEADLRDRPDFMAELEKLPEKERKRALRKAARGAARDALPNGTEAIMVMSANARAIWNTIHLRANAAAEGEIRAVYVQIAQIMEREMPAVFRGLEYVKLWDGSEAVRLPRDKI